MHSLKLCKLICCGGSVPAYLGLDAAVLAAALHKASMMENTNSAAAAVVLPCHQADNITAPHITTSTHAC